MKKGGNARRLRLLGTGIIVGIALLSAPGIARAAGLFVSPSSGIFPMGKNFAVTLRVNSQGTAVNAIEGVLSFNPAQLQVVSVTAPGSIFNLNVQDPEFSNAAGTVKWTGVILNPGYTGTSGNLITVTFKPIAPGETRINYTSGAVLANDGAGTNVLTGMSGGVYTIGTGGPTPTVTPSVGAPTVTSSTHPDQTLWYATNDPIFAWQLPTDVDGVSYLVNPSPSANPGNQSDGVVSTATFTDTPEGANYFHIKFRRGGVWGPVTHFAFNTDTQAPEPFSVVREDESDLTDPRPSVTFATDDAVSGVVRYLMQVDDGEWTEVPESPELAPFTMPLTGPGTHYIRVEAVDRAGNSTRAVLVTVVRPLEAPVITDAPAHVATGDAFTVRGTATPGHRVEVFAYRSESPFYRVLFSDAIASSVTTLVGSDGRWVVQFGGLEAGRYRLQAFARDARDASSFGSESVGLRVGSWFFGLWDSLRHSGLAWWLLGLAVLIAWCWYTGWRCWFWFLGLFRRRKKELPDALQHLIADMDDELVLLKRVEDNRPLYPEERYLRSKLQQYRRSLMSVRVAVTQRKLVKRK